MSIFGWGSRIYSNTDGVTINHSKKISGFTWEKWFGLIKGWAIHINITAWSADVLHTDVESVITLNVIHELAHLCAPGAKTGIHGNTDEMDYITKKRILMWNRFISMAMGHGEMFEIFNGQLCDLVEIHMLEQLSV